MPDTFAIVDGTDKYLMPGLADMHVHLEYANDPRVLDLFLANGVTTVRNMDGRPYILEWRDRIARGEMRGPTIHTAGPILDGDPLCATTTWPSGPPMTPARPYETRQRPGTTS